MSVRWSLGLCLLLAACQPAEVDPAFDEVKGGELLAAYEQARSDGNFELAEQRAEELRRRHGETQAAARMRMSIGQVREKAEKIRETRRLAGLWDYQKVQAGKGVQNTAAIYSKTAPVSEYEAGPRPIPDARLILRRHPDWGDSAYLVLEMDTLRCGPPCVLQIRFDGGEAQAFRGEPADTGTGPALFIKDRDRFLQALRGAQDIRIELPRSGALVPVFEFEVGGFQADRHLKD